MTNSIVGEGGSIQDVESVPCKLCGAGRGEPCSGKAGSQPTDGTRWAHFMRFATLWERAKEPLLIRKMREAIDDEKTP